MVQNERKNTQQNKFVANEVADLDSGPRKRGPVDRRASWQTAAKRDGGELQYNRLNKIRMVLGPKPKNKGGQPREKGSCETIRYLSESFCQSGFELTSWAADYRSDSFDRSEL